MVASVFVDLLQIFKIRRSHWYSGVLHRILMIEIGRHRPVRSSTGFANCTHLFANGRYPCPSVAARYSMGPPFLFDEIGTSTKEDPRVFLFKSHTAAFLHACSNLSSRQSLHQAKLVD